jgi:hypothetical protein
VDGISVECPGKGSGPAEVTVADGAGNTAATEVKVVKAPKLSVTELSAPKKVKAGKSARLRVGVDSTGGAVASGAKVCLSVKGKASVDPACTKLGSLKPGQSAKSSSKLKLKKTAKGKLKIAATVTSKNSADATKSVKIRVKAKG